MTAPSHDEIRRVIAEMKKGSVWFGPNATNDVLDWADRLEQALSAQQQPALQSVPEGMVLIDRGTLEDARDDVCEEISRNEQCNGYARYDRRAEYGRAVLAKIDAALAAFTPTRAEATVKDSLSVGRAGQIPATIENVETMLKED